MAHKKAPEEYRRLADKCRETARTVSAESGRADLLAMALKVTYYVVAGPDGRVAPFETFMLRRPRRD